MWCLTGRVRRMMKRAEATPAKADSVADPDDPAVALAMKIMAEAGASAEEAALEEELAAAKLAFDAASDAERPAAMQRLAAASIRAAAAREARRRYGGEGE